ncbi:hypothetical protein M514_02006 [Trichuris suis]|uniref:Uncharacterized protein n=1 Tax=Trichuris suis TaxID=68888 RepID=A0A085NJJ4_9BILA|nr:hypothetical protein M513_02006 [Trichuris suis]KFD69640.1 hypothetical protein M514_02006 [Trichuris suis]
MSKFHYLPDLQPSFMLEKACSLDAIAHLLKLQRFDYSNVIWFHFYQRAHVPPINLVSTGQLAEVWSWSYSKSTIFAINILLEHQWIAAFTNS